MLAPFQTLEYLLEWSFEVQLPVWNRNGHSDSEPVIEWQNTVQQKGSFYSSPVHKVSI
jgi:hypothetical protein